MKVKKTRDPYGEQIRRTLYPPYDPTVQWDADTADDVEAIVSAYKADRDAGRFPATDVYDCLVDLYDSADTWDADLLDDVAGTFNDGYQPEEPLDYFEEIAEILDPQAQPVGAEDLMPESVREAFRRVTDAYVQDIANQVVDGDPLLDQVLERVRTVPIFGQDDVDFVREIVARHYSVPRKPPAKKSKATRIQRLKRDLSSL